MSSFEQWLADHHFAQTTTRKALGHIRSTEAAIDRGLPVPDDRNVRLTLRRYLSFAEAYDFEDDLTAAARYEGLEPLKRLPREPAPRRQKEIRSFSEDDWASLQQAVSFSEDSRDQVLWVMTLTGLRVGDVLRITHGQLRSGLRSGTLELVRKGGNTTPIALAIPEPWTLLDTGMRKGGYDNVAEYVTRGSNDNPEADGPAYNRVRRRLISLAKKLGLEGEIRTHRLRRTFAVHALEHTDNVKDVQDALGHRSLQSTLGYVDEVNVRKTGRLQRQLAGLPPEE